MSEPTNRTSSVLTPVCVGSAPPWDRAGSPAPRPKVTTKALEVPSIGGWRLHGPGLITTRLGNSHQLVQISLALCGLVVQVGQTKWATGGGLREVT